MSLSGTTAGATGDLQLAGLPLLQQRPFRMLSYTRFSSRVAQNSLNFGLIILIVDATGKAFYSSLLVLALVVPATGAGIASGALADAFPKRLLIFVGDVVRAGICVAVVLGSASTPTYYVVAICLAATGQLASSAEGAVLPAIVRRDELARANAVGHAVGGVAQIVGFVVLTPVVLRVFDSPDTLFAIAAGLFVIAAFQSLFIGSTRGDHRQEVGGDYDGPWWKAGWSHMRGEPAVMHAAVELTLISMTVIILGGLIPSYIDTVLDLPLEVGTLVLTPAAIGVIVGLRVAGFLAHRVPHALLSSVGFTFFVSLLAAVTFVNQEASFLSGYPYLGWLGDVRWGNFDGGAILAMIYMLPLGFGYATVTIAGQTVLNDRVPLSLQGRVLSTQAAMAAIASSIPVLIAGALGDVVGVQPVMALLAVALGVAAIMNLRR